MTQLANIKISKVRVKFDAFDFDVDGTFSALKNRTRPQLPSKSELRKELLDQLGREYKYLCRKNAPFRQRNMKEFKEKADHIKRNIEDYMVERLLEAL